jgi:hypothetical protein
MVQFYGLAWRSNQGCCQQPDALGHELQNLPIADAAFRMMGQQGVNISHPHGCNAVANNAVDHEKSQQIIKSAGLFNCGRGGGIRTHDPLLPKQMRYQAALRPD